ncbi:MAG TPA: phosphatidate cytidylyltransferase [Acidimicrobiales bacterium]|nr:phosphatidate cytidylyltransferase [Acidimicrobiales bacterium]
MDEWDDNFDEEGDAPRPRAEGVRILGAEEAAAAVSAQRAGDAAPPPEPLKFARASEPSPAPPVETPLFPRDDNDPTLSAVPTPAAPPNLPHWTEPPTGEVPAVLSGRFGESDADLDLTEATDDDDLAAWSALSGGAPRWRDQHDDWDDAGYDDASVLAGGDRPLGALDESRTGSMFDFDDDDDADSFGNLGVDDEIAPIPLKPAGVGGGGGGGGLPPRPRPPRPTRAGPAGRRMAPGPAAGAPRDLQAALLLAGGLGAVALILFKLGPAWSMILATAVVLMASAELYDVFRRAGYQPATLVGLVGTLGIMIGAYQKGETALPLALVLVTAATFAWYLIRVVHARPMVNVATTLLAFVWTGVLGSYAALLLGVGKGHDHTGVALVLGVVIAVVANDTGAYFVGSRMGSRPLAPEISPNKTVEGVIGGAVISIVVTVLILAYVPHVHPWDGGKALWLAVVVSLVAPLGDLAESMIKRDLGIKDMGHLLPGHGGVLDRFDALLFCLPAAYYLLRVIA